MKSIKLKADYERSPLWLAGAEGRGNLSFYELPISETLAADLWEWADDYEDTRDREDPARSGFPTPEAGRRFAEMGEELAKRLATELGDEYVVSYFDYTTMQARVV
ncbi:hypothetical protein [Kibdelosporangium phytohabitans]|uniref:Uncharacterized protein n=1 Tax=Kibdelosporangium phytohabitans TaxID=860235 RepID=A0A0N9IDP2_9PSEU|nr:hypothetical protein [Kibdelosporangium phytohabitans]ALG13193.1 hypothetical protein AOZ06_45720 [Kibdelosporangium phytohabitans]MBE1464956.1 hypothetical protein [Kibdelosporangium phytohabitans]